MYRVEKLIKHQQAKIYSSERQVNLPCDNKKKKSIWKLSPKTKFKRGRIELINGKPILYIDKENGDERSSEIDYNFDSELQINLITNYN